ncbi:uncharacterized protein MCYG_02606 [Microsporum canis CBS 113480]|uniref:Uncharacterized protein n=1 Tax=Arthroderma otae (strain ATCC MYA-4605 / CBS 113480) TaxID=554155 RepID=C5FGA2_ARTOC|nr:uncharacterized protein MCYG_02606 [Microsporum canis CBS 113480]EEQ29787.1 predicted protein [Microsporum canis CBS 113480]
MVKHPAGVSRASAQCFKADVYLALDKRVYEGGVSISIDVALLPTPPGHIKLNSHVDGISGFSRGYPRSFLPIRSDQRQDVIGFLRTHQHHQYELSGVGSSAQSRRGKLCPETNIRRKGPTKHDLHVIYHVWTDVLAILRFALIYITLLLPLTAQGI